MIPASRTVDREIRPATGVFQQPVRPPSDVVTVNQASELLNALFPPDYFGGRKTAIIIDEFDQLQNKQTIDFLTSLAKQMSVDRAEVTLIFYCFSNDLRTLLGSHESVSRYITAIHLSPLSDVGIWGVVDGICSNFFLEVPRSQKIRIGQVACGYPTFAHLIAEEVLNVAFEQEFSGRLVTQDIFNEAMRRAAGGAATQLQSAYEAATMKGTDRYVEVLWAVANGPHIRERQFKDVRSDYDAIMSRRLDRDRIEKEQTLRNHVNALCSEANGAVLERLKSGWYRFTDPMFRGYVRMLAYNEGIELGDESFLR